MNTETIQFIWYISLTVSFVMLLNVIYLRIRKHRATTRRITRKKSSRIMRTLNTYWVIIMIVDEFKFTNSVITIGCQTRSVKEWDYFFSDECDEVIHTLRNYELFETIKQDYMFAREQVLNVCYKN